MKNINWSMIVFSITQVETWIESYELELRSRGKALNSNDRVLLSSLKSAIEKFNKAIHTDKEDLLEYSGAISVINEMIAKGDDTQATVILESLKFLAKHTQALTSNGVEEMAERLQLISDTSDYLMNFPMENLRKLSTRVMKTKIKPKMKELPILMSTPMVQAILQGRKTQTRRIVKNGTPLGDFDETLKKCPYGKVGDTLWVRETYLEANCFEYSLQGFVYKANDEEAEHAKEYNIKWKPSIFMPKIASRIKLLVKNIRIERLKDISKSDAIAEGMPYLYDKSFYVQANLYYDYIREEFGYQCPIDSYSSLWESINGEDSWEENPLVWVVEFERI